MDSVILSVTVEYSVVICGELVTDSVELETEVVLSTLVEVDSPSDVVDSVILSLTVEASVVICVELVIDSVELETELVLSTLVEDDNPSDVVDSVILSVAVNASVVISGELVTDSVEVEASVDGTSEVVVSSGVVVSLVVTFVVSWLGVLEIELVLSTLVDVDNPASVVDSVILSVAVEISVVICGELVTDSVELETEVVLSTLVKDDNPSDVVDSVPL